MISESRRDSVGISEGPLDSVGGGGSSRIFPSSPPMPTLAEIFRGLRNRMQISGGGGSTRNFSLLGPFYIFRLTQRGGGPGPPSESATVLCRPI